MKIGLHPRPTALFERYARYFYDPPNDDVEHWDFRRRAKVLILSCHLATRRHGTPLSVLALDVDHFKRVNDDHGHAAGDQVLSGVAALLRANVRQEDVVARVGGEEFVVLLRGSDTPGAQAAAERLRAAIAEARFGAIAVTASVGGATAAGIAVDGARLMSRADALMYSAKRAGRDRVRVGELAGPDASAA